MLALAPVWSVVTPAQTNPPAAAVAAVAQRPVADRDLFFTEFTRIAQLVRQGARTEALGLLNILQRKLSTSPWLGIAMLKHCQLAEATDQRAAMEGYQLLLKRIANAPFYRGAEEQAQLFSTVLRGAAQRGINRIRLARIRNGLQKYFSRHTQYPESLAKLAVLNYVDMEEIVDAEGEPFRYIPTGMQFRPLLTYMRFELAKPPADPFLNPTPKVDATSRISDDPPAYTALVRVPGRREPARVAAGQAIEGFYFAEVAAGGVIACTGDRVLVLLVR
ncbi:hypothetical protein HQ590_13115 [bacterium]|nr:hypothetical protein [bacterium]